ncbi:hypothetical protein SY83_10415 [Paenibacillus swuensis]|uniref:Uncharacterized protein n=2 Tax=Paenibacillus swuensis TaxID=1178515 RepID=A0A172TPA3_9BACL|nr:hypothetical protein SY83_10415 [Paenibacillus swuensis]
MTIDPIQLTNDGGVKVAKAMTLIAWVLLGIGVAMFLMTMSNFRDSNLGLMVAIGFVIAGMQVYGLGTFVNLISTKSNRND